MSITKSSALPKPSMLVKKLILNNKKNGREFLKKYREENEVRYHSENYKNIGKSYEIRIDNKKYSMRKI